MGKRIPCILLLVVTMASADAILRTDPNVARRYGPPSKRPAYGPNNAYPPPQYGPPPSTTGQYMPPTGHTSYQSSTGYSSSTYGNPIVPKPPSSSYGPPPSAPSVSYSRPFGLPEGHRFPNGGYTFKFPQVPPPRPPVKALYISKPYPDYVIRFKPPAYPAEVPVLNKPGYGNAPPAIPSYKPPSYPRPPSSYPPTGPAPVYSPTGPIKSSIPIYEDQSGTDKQVVTVIASTQDVNVGTSYQTGSNANKYHSGLPSKIPVYSEAPSSVPLYPGQPPSTSAVYVISNDRLSNDKPQTGPNVKTFVELSNDQAFGVTDQPGVVRPLTPDIVYSPNDPNNGAEFKPMYLFGPVFFPKGEGEAAVDSTGSDSRSSSVSTELKSAAPVEAAAITPVVTVKNLTVTSNDLADAVEAINDDPADEEVEPVSSSGGGTGGGRGILGVVESILGIDDAEDDGMSRADEEEEEEEEEKEVEPEEENNRNNEDLTSDRDSEGKRKSKPKYKSRSKTRSSSSTRRKNRNRNKNRTKAPSHNRGTHDVGGEPLEQSAEEKEEEAHKRPTASVKNPEFESIPEYGENAHSQGDDEPEPIIGPVQIGYIGRPPQGVSYDPNQPFFYPAGIPPYGVQDSFMDEQERNPVGSQEQGGVRRHFDMTESPSVYEQSEPQNSHQMDLMVAPTAELEQPVPQEVSALDNQKVDLDVNVPETSTIVQVREPASFNRPMYAYNYPSYYDTASVQGQGHDQTSVQGPSYDSSASSEKFQDAQHSAEYAPVQDTSSVHQPSGSYSPGIQDTTSNAYADNSDHLQQPSSYPQVDQDISSTATDQVDASSNELTAVNGLVSQSGEVLDKQGVSSISHAPDTQYDYSSPSYSDAWSSSSESAHAVSVDSLSVETSSPASLGSTRRPFPSFHHYRVGYRPKYNRNYVAPTTYRPAYRHPSSTAETDKEHIAGDDIDTSATIYNSLHYDITTTSSPINVDEHFIVDAITSTPINLDEHFNFDTTTTSAPETVTKPNRGGVRFGDKISLKQKPS